MGHDLSLTPATNLMAAHAELSLILARVPKGEQFLQEYTDALLEAVRAMQAPMHGPGYIDPDPSRHDEATLNKLVPGRHTSSIGPTGSGKTFGHRVTVAGDGTIHLDDDERQELEPAVLPESYSGYMQFQCPELHHGVSAPLFGVTSHRAEFIASFVDREACEHITPEERAELKSGRVPARLVPALEPADECEECGGPECPLCSGCPECGHEPECEER